MKVVIRPTANDAAELVARLVARDLRDNPRLTLGLATGRTMESVYERLAAMHSSEGLDFSLCRTFNLDEYAGLKPDDPNSYRFFMNSKLFNKTNIDLGNTHLPDGMAADTAIACRRYEEAITRAGGIDLQLLGIGQNGHVGFNEPLSPLHSRTREITLSPETLAQNSVLFGGDIKRMPRRAITMGVGTILESRKCLLLALGSSKADILPQAVEGPVTSMISASALQFHPCCTVIADEPAAAKLKGAEHYKWMFENEAEWEPFR